MTGQPFDARLVETIHGPLWVFGADVFISRSLEYYGEYSFAETEIFQQIVKPGAVVVEVGANIGAHTVMLARSCAPGLLYAFEPQQRAFQLLCANIVQNQLTNVRAFPDAIGEAEGWAGVPHLNYTQDGNFGCLSVAAELAQSAAMAPVQMVTLDGAKLPACDFLKIDVEGWETSVLRGARNLIARFRPVIYVENDRARQQAELIRLIDELGYTQYWHVAPLFRPANFNNRSEDIFRGTVSLNMLCIANDRPIEVAGLERIDPANWVSPVKPG